MADFNYVGNPDFRGYLNYLSQSTGNPFANAAISGGNSGLGLVNNQAQYGTDDAIGQYLGGVSAADTTSSVNNFKDYINNAYQAYQGFLNPTTTGGGGYAASTSATAAPVIDPKQVALYDQAIGNTNAGINRLGDQFNSGVSGIDASYQNALNQLLLGKNQGQQAYDTNTQQTKQNYVTAKNSIGANAGNTLSGLWRLLGSRGAGGGTPGQTAGQAVARGATQQRNDVGQTYGQNLQALDTNWNNFLTGYNNQVSSAGSQRDQQKQGLQQSIDSNRASLLQSLAQLNAQKASYTGGNPAAASQPFLDQANNLLNSTSNYRTAPINYQTQAYNAPSLGSYTFNPQTPTYQGQAPTNDYFSPYLSALLGKKQPLGAG